MGSPRRRVVVLVLAAVFVALLILFPLVLAPVPHDATKHAKAVHLLFLATFMLVIVLDLGAMALVAAREIRGVFDDYRAQRHDALNQLVTSVAKAHDRADGHNGKPLE